MKWTCLLPSKARYQPSPFTISFCLFFASVQYCWIAERTNLFEKTSKSSDARLFLLCAAASVLLTLKSWSVDKPLQQNPISHSQEVFILPREQTEEWKGWMQAVILLYHYFGLSNNLPVYQLVRVLVAAYIFLTGYSHTSYFLKTNDFSLNRTIKTLLRLNLLTCVLSYTLDRPCDFYYFPLLTSFWYMVMLITLGCARGGSTQLSPHRVCISLAVSCASIQALLYTATGNGILISCLSWLDRTGGPHIDGRELIFRLKLDAFMPYWGALFSLWGSRTQSETTEQNQQSMFINTHFQKLLAIHSPWIALATLTPYFLAIQQFKDKFVSNRWHPFISIIPIAAFLLARNASQQHRQGYNRIFKWLGSISLETYVLQSHIWLTNNNKGLLHIGILGRIVDGTHGILRVPIALLDSLMLTVIFLLASHITAQATKPLIDWITSGSKMKMIHMMLVLWLLNLHWKLF